MFREPFRSSKKGDKPMMATRSSDHSSSDESSVESTASVESTEFHQLLVHARQGDTQSLGRLLQWYSNYLGILANTQLDRRLRRRVNPSDVVQETMLAAHRDFGDFKGRSQGELLSWLRTILIHTLHRTFDRHVKVAKRDIRREVSIDEVANRLEKSTNNLAALLPSHDDSPSAPMQKRERSIEFANQLSQLRPQYRDVIVYRILQGLSFQEIADKMDRTEAAVRMLWLRALDAFRVHEEARHDES
tara:strand:- start:93143 stop:93880 length:738 start_codon:yes stop_codon:yes gene_type:complete